MFWVASSIVKFRRARRKYGEYKSYAKDQYKFGNGNEVKSEINLSSNQTSCATHEKGKDSGKNGRHGHRPQISCQARLKLCR